MTSNVFIFFSVYSVSGRRGDLRGISHSSDAWHARRNEASHLGQKHVREDHDKDATVMATTWANVMLKLNKDFCSG